MGDSKLVVPSKTGIKPINQSVLNAFDIKCDDGIRCNSLKWLWIYKDHTSFIDTANIKLLSKGKYGKVYKTQKKNIVKTIKFNTDQYNTIDDFLNKIKIEIKLQTKAHKLIKDKNGKPITPKVLQAGVFLYNFEYYGIIFMKQTKGETINYKYIKKLEPSVLEDIIIQLNSVLKQLETNKISHNDLHDRNILLNKNNIIHIIDWGLGRDEYRDERMATTVIGTIRRLKESKEREVSFGKRNFSEEKYLRLLG